MAAFPIQLHAELAVAMLPASRSVQVGTAATAFATIINGGTTAAIGCGISLTSAVAADFLYQSTNPASNELSGEPNSPVDIAAGGNQTYLVSLIPSAPFPTTEIQFSFACADQQAPILPGLNTLSLTASNNAVPDIVALAATSCANGIVSIKGSPPSGSFSVAAVNLGSSSSISVSAEIRGGLSISSSLCETDTDSGECLNTPATVVMSRIEAGETPTFAVFLQSDGRIPFNPEKNRVSVEFRGSDNVLRGSTSVAVRNQETSESEVVVAPIVETRPVPSSGDAADDPAIWVHPTQPGLSRVIGTDKGSGLAVYDLAGKELQFLPVGRVNNVDVQYNFPLGEKSIDLVVGSERATDRLLILEIDPVSGLLRDIAENGGIETTLQVYGLCLYRSPFSGKVYAIVNSKTGEVEQWELFARDRTVDASQVRGLRLGSQVEGCVADNEKGVFYVGEEDVGIWRFGAEPGGGDVPLMVDSTGPNGHLTADVEGLALYYASDGTGYLIASSQGSDSFVIYRRENGNDFVGTFRIGAAVGIDGVSLTDGISVANSALGAAFPNGVFVAQDDFNLDERQNFKLVPWNSIADALVPPLTIDTRWSPRVFSR